MKTAMFVLVAALACQAAMAGWKKSDKKGDSYSSKDSYGKSSYGSDSYGKDAYAAPTVVEVQGAPITVEKVETCRPATVAITADPTMECGSGYTMGKEGSCSRKVCHEVRVKVEAAPVVYAHAETYGHDDDEDSYGKDAKKSSGKAKYGFFKKSKKSSKDSYKSKDSYGEDSYAPKDTYKTETVCTTVTAKAHPTCGKGATMAAGKCIVGSKTNDCPTGFTAGKGVCTKVTVETRPGPKTYVTVEAEKDSYSHETSAYGKSDDKHSKAEKYGWFKKMFSKKSKDSKKDSYKSKDSYEKDSYIPACPAPVKVEAKPETKPAVVVVAVEAKAETKAEKY